MKELESELDKRSKFDEAILSKLGSSLELPEIILPPEDNIIDGGMSDDPNTGDSELPTPEEDPIDPVDGKPLFEQSLNDVLINAEVLLPIKDVMENGKVIRRNGENTTSDGSYNAHPLFNSVVLSSPQRYIHILYNRNIIIH